MAVMVQSGWFDNFSSYLWCEKSKEMGGSVALLRHECHRALGLSTLVPLTVPAILARPSQPILPYVGVLTVEPLTSP